MLKPGQKGTILQRDKKTYAIAPHIPCGLVTPDMLRKLADVADKYDVQTIKITGATRIALIGIEESAVDPIWNDLGMSEGHAVGLCVRSVRACPGTRHCRLGQQDALAVGLALDQRYHGQKLPGKAKLAVSGCNLNCAESWVRDIGLIGKPQGWTLVIGGNVGPKPRIAQMLAEGLPTPAALQTVDRVVQYYLEKGKKGERLGRMLDRVGLAAFLEFIEESNL